MTGTRNIASLRDGTYQLIAQLRLECDRGFEHRVLIVVYVELQQQEQ